ncbi:MAG: RcnB family protein [Hyphomonadaceae bacterium]
MKKLLVAASLAVMALSPAIASAAPMQHYSQAPHASYQQTRVTYAVNGHRYEAQRGPAWRAPHNYRHQNWRRNQRLPMEYRRVEVRDYRAYHLPPPTRGQHWVRVDHDAILVGLTSGIIGAVIANAFIN